MKAIKIYILENSNKYGDPDSIIHHNKEYSFDSEYARAIIYSLHENKCLWSKPGETHNDLLFNLNDADRKKCDLYKNGKDIRYVDDLSKGELEKRNKCGRIWVVPNNISKHRKFDVYIAWWNELDETEFNKINKTVIKQYNHDFKQNLESFIGVDNNGKFILIDPEGQKIKIDKQDKNRKEDLVILKAIHLASQEEKNAFFKGWKARVAAHKEKELQKLGIRDGTYAKRNNMFAKHTVYDKETGKYKVVYGAKIGDSFIDKTIQNNNYNMKSLIEYILEKKTIGFGEMNPKYGQCVILAGGAASGKGFIQSRIDMQGKVFDVDELKKKYQKLAKAGIFKDDYEYDLTNPEDTGKLHQKVKEMGLKGKERKHFWKERKGAEGRDGIKADKKHSSGLLPNVIFDMVSDDIKDIKEVVTQAKGNGYNVTLVWVVCNKDTAVISNTIRGIDAKGKARSVPAAALEKGHKGAYETITKLFNNKYPEINEFIDIAWIGFSCGWGRHLDDNYENSPVIKVKKDSNNKFNWNQNDVDSFLKTQQPIDYAFLKEIEDNKKDDEKTQWSKKKLAKFKELADDFDEKKLNECEETTSENVLIEALVNEMRAANIIE